jgi:membrane protease YdiL (CAAX protease family)
VPARTALALWALGAVSMSAAFLAVRDHWTGVLLAMVVCAAVALGVPVVRQRLRARPRARDFLVGAAAGVALLLGTCAGIAVLERLWPGWGAYGRALVGWKGGHARAYLLATLPVIVAGEELVWRGVVQRWAAERFGRGPAGLLAGAALYALAHAGALNPLLVAAALGCGLVWAWLHLWTDRFVAPFLCHLVWDYAILFVLVVVPGA